LTIAQDAAEENELRYATYPSFRDRVAFVSGGSTGLGSEFVSALAAQGARVGFADIDVAGAERLLERLSRTDCPEPLFVEADVRDVGQVRAAVAEVGDGLGPISILVNNAANDARHDSDTVDEAYWDSAIAINLKHHFFVIQAVVLRTLARELGPDRIRVNCLIPGWVFTERQLAQLVTPETLAKLDQVQSLKDNIMPADVARMVLWLAADDSAMCTGQKWIVDGGWM
jgi:NAD(P)-dependent dehydrogenase (short-subunit alcohol dehydrogenase family)